MPEGLRGESSIAELCRKNGINQNLYYRWSAAEQLSLSPRSCQRVLKVARTIADLDSANRIAQDHLAEAIGFRQPVRR